VPERLLPIACLAIAALVAVVVDRLRAWPLVAVALVLLAADLHFTAYRASAASPGRAAVVGAPGRMIELPVYLPDNDLGSVYLYYDMAAQVERPFGYALGPNVTDRYARESRSLTCGDWRGQEDRLRGLGVNTIVVHGGLYALGSRGIWFAWRALLDHGWGPVAQDGRVTRFARGGSASVVEPQPPSKDEVVRCTGWRDDVLAVPPGILWAYGGATVALHLRSTATAVVSVDGVERASSTGELRLRIPLAPGRWHELRIDRRGHGDVRLLSLTRR
jgi:hypothetical protein